MMGQWQMIVIGMITHHLLQSVKKSCMVNNNKIYFAMQFATVRFSKQYGAFLGLTKR